MLGLEAAALNKIGRNDTQLLIWFEARNGYYGLESPTFEMHIGPS
jgi:hypothetical protein